MSGQRAAPPLEFGSRGLRSLYVPEFELHPSELEACLVRIRSEAQPGLVGPGGTGPVLESRAGPR